MTVPSVPKGNGATTVVSPAAAANGKQVSGAAKEVEQQVTKVTNMCDGSLCHVLCIYLQDGWM